MELEVQKQTIRDIADRLDAHRKRQKQLHSSLTLTDIYNVLEKLRANEELTEEDREREYPLLAPQALAERLRLVARLFPPNAGYEFAIRFRRRA